MVEDEEESAPPPKKKSEGPWTHAKSVKVWVEIQHRGLNVFHKHVKGKGKEEEKKKKKEAWDA